MRGSHHNSTTNRVFISYHIISGTIHLLAAAHTFKLRVIAFLVIGLVYFSSSDWLVLKWILVTERWIFLCRIR